MTNKDEFMSAEKFKETIKIVAVKHINYQLEPCSEVLYFKTNEDINIDDFVFCNTCYGLAVCKVVGIYQTLEEIFKLKKLPILDHLKECRTTLEEK